MFTKPIANRIRGAYQSYINITYGVGSMLGAALGGAMVDTLGWRWEFGVQVPGLALGVIVAIIAIPNDIGLYGKKKEGFWEAMRAFDFKGSILMSSSITFLILGLVRLLPGASPCVRSTTDTRHRADLAQKNLGGNVLPCE